jgi:hypothetical protein
MSRTNPSWHRRCSATARSNRLSENQRAQVGAAGPIPGTRGFPHSRLSLSRKRCQPSLTALLRMIRLRGSRFVACSYPMNRSVRWRTVSRVGPLTVTHVVRMQSVLAWRYMCSQPAKLRERASILASERTDAAFRHAQRRTEHAVPGHQAERVDALNSGAECVSSCWRNHRSVGAHHGKRPLGRFDVCSTFPDSVVARVGGAEASELVVRVRTRLVQDGNQAVLSTAGRACALDDVEHVCGSIK